MRPHGWRLSIGPICLVLAIGFSSIPLPAFAIIKVACCGDSITYGVGVPDRSTQSYPAVLQGLLGNEYQILRPAAGGLTLLKKGDYSFWRDNAYRGTIAAEPNIIIVLLGTNDSKPVNWQYGAEFESDYHALIDSFSAIPTRPKIMLALPPP
ncbi:MAG TPA: GDSL-type esterase/lipase family protein, partial [Opitutaceae bacterium]